MPFNLKETNPAEHARADANAAGLSQKKQNKKFLARRA
jgi:hypothetical protein